MRNNELVKGNIQTKQKIYIPMAFIFQDIPEGSATARVCCCCLHLELDKS